MTLTPDQVSALAGGAVAIIGAACVAIAAWLRKLAEPKAADPPASPSCAADGLSGSLAAITETLAELRDMLLVIKDRTDRR